MNKAFSITFGIIGGFVAWGGIALAICVAGLVIIAVALKEPPAPPEPTLTAADCTDAALERHFNPRCLEVGAPR